MVDLALMAHVFSFVHPPSCPEQVLQETFTGWAALISCPASLEHQGLHRLRLLLLRAALFPALFSLPAFAYSPNGLVPNTMGNL